MLTPEMADRLIAPPGTLLVEREDLQKSYAGILVLSPNYTKHTIGSVAYVRSVGAGVEGWSVGDKVLLSATAGRPIELGWNAERTLWRVSPASIMLQLDVETDAKHLGAHPLRSVSDAELAATVRLEHAEGDREGLR